MAKEEKTKVCEILKDSEHHKKGDKVELTPELQKLFRKLKLIK